MVIETSSYLKKKIETVRRGGEKERKCMYIKNCDRIMNALFTRQGKTLKSDTYFPMKLFVFIEDEKDSN